MCDVAQSTQLGVSLTASLPLPPPPSPLTCRNFDKINCVKFNAAKCRRYNGELATDAATKNKL